MRSSNIRFALRKLSLKTSDYRVLQLQRFVLQKLFRSKDAPLVEREFALPRAMCHELPFPKSDLGGKGFLYINVVLIIQVGV